MSAEPYAPEEPAEASPGQSFRPGASDLGFDLPAPASLHKTRSLALALGVLVTVAGAFLAGYLPKRHASLVLEQSARDAEHTLVRVGVVKPELGASDRTLSLPGSVSPLEETVLYSRANGYVRRWLVDIGDKVSEGQLLAEIDAPEIDQELVQARAQLAEADARVLQAIANRDLAQADLARYERLAPAGMASQQEFEQKQAAAAVGRANVVVAQAAIGAQKASIQRLLQLKSFAHMVAPFGGTVTLRSVDRGTLVTAGNSTPLFKIVATDPVRVFVQVPQDVAPSVRAGVNAKVRVREYPGRVFGGVIARAAGVLDPVSRTMTIEIRVSNQDGALIAGMYSEVALTLPAPHRVFEIPATAIFNGSQGVRIAVVNRDSKIQFVPVTIERDTGVTVQVSTGLVGDEQVVKIANADLTEGIRVEVIR